MDKGKVNVRLQSKLYKDSDSIALGCCAKDTITGFRGMIVGRCEYLNGTVQWQVQPEELVNGVPIPAQWFDDNRMEIYSKWAYSIGY